MTGRKFVRVLIVVFVAALITYFVTTPRGSEVALTGMVDRKSPDQRAVDESAGGRRLRGEKGRADRGVGSNGVGSEPCRGESECSDPRIGGAGGAAHLLVYGPAERGLDSTSARHHSGDERAIGSGARGAVAQPG